MWSAYKFSPVTAVYDMFSEHNLELVCKLLGYYNAVHASTSKYTMASINEQKCRKWLGMWGLCQLFKGHCSDSYDRYRLQNFSIYYIFTCESVGKRLFIVRYPFFLIGYEDLILVQSARFGPRTESHSKDCRVCHWIKCV